MWMMMMMWVGLLLYVRLGYFIGYFGAGWGVTIGLGIGLRLVGSV